MDEVAILAAHFAAIFILLALCLICAYLISTHKLHWFPESAASMVVGFIAGIIIIAVDPGDEVTIEFSPQIFFFGLLPPIVLSAGYSMKRRDFFHNLTTITLFAVVGTLISTAVIGVGLYLLVHYNVLTGDAYTNYTLLDALIFASLLSAVDPVATLSILGNKDVNADSVLYNIVFGESVLNDAVCIVLFDTLINFQKAGKFTALGVLEGIGQFVYISIASVLIGMACALLCSLLYKRIGFGENQAIEFLLIFLTANISYLLSQVAGLSGIISLFFCGIFLAHYNWYNISDKTQFSTRYGFEAMALGCETIVFIYLGFTTALSLHPENHFKWNFPLIFAILVLCLLGRAVHVFSLSALVNLGRKKALSFKMQVVMWFAGLRGAIAFALALNIPGNSVHTMVTCTLAVVIFTTFICGGFTEKLVDKLGLKGSGGAAQEALLEGSVQAGPRPRTKRTGLHGLWKKFDTNYLKPVFGGSPDILPYVDDDDQPALSEAQTDWTASEAERSFD